MTLLALVGFTLFILGMVAWLVLRRRAQFSRVPWAPRPSEVRPAGALRTVSFPARDGTRLDGWLFLPAGRTGPAPLVVMAPGLGGTKDGFLESFAWRFAEHGVGALVFDYRCFGGSDGLPRHWVDPARHREDYEAALAFAQGALAEGGEVDPARVGLWGSSFSGGTALVTCAGRPDVRALVVQCPFLKTPPHIQPKGWAMARFVFWAVLDLLRVLPPIYVPLFGRPGEWVFAPSRENPKVSDFDGPEGALFWKALPKPGLGGWENRMLARMLSGMDEFVPMDHAAKVTCPALFIAAREDDMVPLAYVEEGHLKAKSPAKALSVFDCGHFNLYLGETHVANALTQARFLARALRAEPTDEVVA